MRPAEEEALRWRRASADAARARWANPRFRASMDGDRRGETEGVGLFDDDESLQFRVYRMFTAGEARGLLGPSDGPVLRAALFALFTVFSNF